MPLADIARPVAVFTKMVGKCLQIGWQWDTVSVTPRFSGVKPGLQARPRGTTNRLTCKRVVDMCSPACHPIKIRCQIQRIAVDARCIPPLLVCEKHDHIGLV